MEKVEIKNLCPMIAAISAGKTSLLNVIFNIDFLEINSGIGTKFVNIIRYNKEVGENPLFYHLILKNIGNGDYEYYRDPKFTIVGKENIKKAIIDINKKLRENENCNYEELFYMVEIGGSDLIKDEEYLKNYDLVDVPGVSEFRRQEKNDIEEKKEEFETPKEDEVKDENPALSAIADMIKDVPIIPKDYNRKEVKLSSSKVEKKMMNYEPDKEQNYLTEIFKIIKNKMNNGIIVFSVDNLILQESYDIVGKLQKIINKPIKNYLILLNMIDKSENEEEDLQKLKNNILSNFPKGTFNINENFLVPCSAIQLKNEIKMENSFFHLIYYHYINFLKKHKKENASTQNTTTNSFSFIQYLIPFIHPEKKALKKEKFVEKIAKIIKDKDFEKYIKEIKETIDFITSKNKDETVNIGIRKDEFEKEDIEKIMENLNEDNEEEQEEDEENKDDFNLYKQEGNAIFLYYYSEFKYSKKTTLQERSTIQIKNYFTVENMKANKGEELKKIEEEILNKDNKNKSLNDKIDDISERMKIFFKEFEDSKIKEEKLPMLNKKINSSIGILKVSKLLYIPILGVSNAGKSTIFNGLIGERLLPTQQKECTKKGILIKYSNIDTPIIRKANFIKDKIGKEELYYFEPANVMGKGIEQIREILKAGNGEFIEDEEDFFYVIDIRIQYIHENKQMDEDLKEKICFIDLPGFGTGDGNKFETQGIYERLMQSSNIFLFVVRNLKIKENDNHEMLNRIYNKMVKFRGITSQSFLNKCLFIINCDKEQEISPETSLQARKDIISIINNLEKCSPNDINVTFFNAKIFENYVFKLKYYSNPEFLFYYEQLQFDLSNEQFFRGFYNKLAGNKFNKYLIEQLKNNTKQDISHYKFDEKKVKIDENIKNIVMILAKYNYPDFPQKDLDLIIKYISFGKQHILNSELIQLSNSEQFKNDLKYFIEKGKKQMEKEINQDLKNTFDILDDLFGLDHTQRLGNLRDPPKMEIIPPKAEEDLTAFEKEIQELLDKIIKDFSENNVVSVLINCREELDKALLYQKENIEKSLKELNMTKVQTNFEKVFKDKTNNLKEKLYDVIEKASKSVQEHYSKCYELINKFYAKAISPEELLFKNFLSTKLGRENDIKLAIEEIVNDILASSREVSKWKNRTGFLDGLKTLFSSSYELNKIIKCMIEQSTSKISDFEKATNKYVEMFKTNIQDEINTKTQTVRNILNEQKEKEEMIKKDQEKKNEQEQKLWEEEKGVYEDKKRKWEETCKKYSKLREDIFSMRLFEN